MVVQLPLLRPLVQKKLPGCGMVFICAGQIVNDRFLGKTTGAGYGDGQEQENLLHRS